MPGMTSIQKLLKFLLWHRIGSVLKSLVGHLKRMCAVIAGPVNAGWFWLAGRTLVFLHLLWHCVQFVYRLLERVLRFPS